MSSSTNFPGSCLVAILLVCNTREGSGAQIIYHYPPDPLSEGTSYAKSSLATEESNDDTSSDTDESTTDDEDFDGFFGTIRKPGTHATGLKPRSNSDDDKTASDVRSGWSGAQSRDLLGFPEDGLVSLLNPDRMWHKKKFELSINDLTFVGRPVFVRHDGSWVKKKRASSKRNKAEEPISDTASASEDDPVPNGKQPDETAASNSLVRPEKSQLTMFHVVFVMNPPPLEQVSKVKEMYDHVIKKFSRALKWEQVHNDYVWKQSEIIADTKASALVSNCTRLQMYYDIAEKSSLAVAIATIFSAISSSRIASVTLSPKVRVSLQIPPATSTAYLPSLTEPPMQPGVWLTTATDIGSAISDNDATSANGSLQLAKHYTLLLKSPPQRIAKDAQEAGGSLAQHLPRFLSSLRPTKSFYKCSAATSIPLAEIQLLAEHLIYWRRAIAIPPLHQRDTYIVSPNANLDRLRDASKLYESQFPPTMPSLPKLLSALSGIPRPFGTLIPSRDHKEVYYLALAWLMRNGWVTQLRTFTYIRVSPEIKRLVRDVDRDRPLRSSPNKATKDGDADPKEPTRTSTARPRLVSNPSSDGRRSLTGIRAGDKYRMASLILNPPRASAEESKWLNYIDGALHGANELHLKLSKEDRIDLQKYWPSFIKYFNGRVAMETVPIRENLKKKLLWNLLDKMGMSANRGVESEEGSNRTLLVAVQHW